MKGYNGGISLYCPLSMLNLTMGGLGYGSEPGWELDGTWELVSGNGCGVMFACVSGEAEGVGGVTEHCVTTSMACTTLPLQPFNTNSSTRGE